MLTTEAAQLRPFEMRVEGFGSYPTSRRPRVLWVGLNAPAALASLQHAIEAATSRLGYPSEEREFSPHLTIGRVRQNVSAADLQKIRTALEERMRNLRNRLPPRADPKAEIIESDARRAAYVQRYFGENWQDYRLYHMVIDSTIGIIPAVDAILCAARLAKAASEVPATR